MGKAQRTPDVALARNQELARRRQRARGRAYRDLAEWHAEDYALAYKHALERVHREAGPLPGD